MKYSIHLLLPAIAIFLIAAGVILFILRSNSIRTDNQVKSTDQINNFADCVAAGYPIMESYPEVCKTPDGRSFTHQTTPRQIPPSEITITGEFQCLPHKDTTGSQTMECAYGLMDSQGKYYSLRDSDPDYKNIMSAQMGGQIEVSGTLTVSEQNNSTYQDIGTIEVKSIRTL